MPATLTGHGDTDAPGQFRPHVSPVLAASPRTHLLRFAEVRFLTRRAVLEKQAGSGRRGSRVDDPTAYQAEGVLYLTPLARFDQLLRLPEGADAGKAVNAAMRDIEVNNPQLAGVLPGTYQIFDSTQARAQVRLAIEDTLDEGLPRSFTPDIYQRKCAVLFEHVFESFGDGTPSDARFTVSPRP